IHEDSALLEIAIKAAAIQRYEVDRTADTNDWAASVVNVGQAIPEEVPAFPLFVPRSAEIVPGPNVEAGVIVHLGVRKLRFVTVSNQRHEVQPIFQRLNLSAGGHHQIIIVRIEEPIGHGEFDELFVAASQVLLQTE